jgi:hypothetical protein
LLGEIPKRAGLETGTIMNFKVIGIGEAGQRTEVER